MDALAHLLHTNKDRYNLSTKIFRLWELSPYWTPNMFPFEKLPTTPQPTKMFKYFKNDGDMAQLNVQTMFVSSKHLILRVGRHSVVKKYLNAFLLFWYLMTINFKKKRGTTNVIPYLTCISLVALDKIWLISDLTICYNGLDRLSSKRLNLLIVKYLCALK